MQSLNQKTNTRNLITFLLNFISLEDNSIYKKYMLSAFYVFEHCICLEPEKKKYGSNFAFYFYFYFPPSHQIFRKKSRKSINKKMLALVYSQNLNAGGAMKAVFVVNLF